MSLAALLFCYSCDSSESGGKKEKILSLCKECIEICEEGIDRMRAAESYEEYDEIREVYDRRIDKWREKAKNSVSDEDAEKLYESDAEVAKAVDEMRIIGTKFDNIEYRSKR